MRWALLVLGAFLLLWLASGEAHAQPWGPPWPPPPPPAPPPPTPAVTFGPMGPGSFGAWVDLGASCSPAGEESGHVVRVHFLLDGIVYHAVKHLACPTTAAYVGMQLPLPPGARSVVHDVYAEIGGYNGQRFPAAGYALDQPVQGNERPADAVAWSTVDLGAMCTLFLVSWWRDPTRGQRVALALSP